MNLEGAQRYGTDAAAKRAVANLARPVAAGGHEHHSMLESVREADHHGHHIMVKTKYTIQVDGKALRTPLHVTNDGQVRCHALPNYSFDSAVDLVKQIIDAFPEDFAETGGADGHAGHESHDHDGHGASGPARHSAVRGKSPTTGGNAGGSRRRPPGRG